MRLRTILTVALFGLMATAVLAQQPGQRGEGQRGEGQRGDGQRGEGQRGRGGPPGGGFGFFGGGGGMSRLMLLGISEVQKELELADEQVKEIQKIQEDFRARFRGPGGPPGGGGERRGRGGDGNRGDRTSVGAPAEWYFVQAQEQGQGRRGGGFGQLTEEQRAEFEKVRVERAREEKAKLADILLPNQLERLTQIFVQVAGVEALRDEDVAKELALSDAQAAKISEVRRANQEALGEQMRGLFGGGGGEGDRDAARAKMEEFRKTSDAKLLAVLTPDQQKTFDEMKGKPFKMPEGFGRGGFGGRGGPPGGPGGERGKRGGDNRN